VDFNPTFRHPAVAVGAAQVCIALFAVRHVHSNAVVALAAETMEELGEFLRLAGEFGFEVASGSLASSLRGY